MEDDQTVGPVELVETVEMKRCRAKELGIRQYFNMKEETLDERIAIAETAKESEVAGDEMDEIAKEDPIKITDKELIALKELGFKKEWLPSVINQYGFNSVAYVNKFHAFRCFKNNAPVDWIDINDLSLLNGGRRLLDIKVKHTPVSKNPKYPNRGIINMPWRS